MTTHEYCAQQAEEIQQLRGLVFSAAYRLRSLRRLSNVCAGGCALSAPAAEEIDGILAILAEHEMGREELLKPLRAGK